MVAYFPGGLSGFGEVAIIKKVVDVPVLANGNIKSWEDVKVPWR